jgi:ubiquinone/menaquinone biosynthesis C-methylase UbiE
MDLEHEVWRIMIGHNTLTPLKDPQRILDLGTGTGIWAVEVADEFPSAHVRGNDLSPVQPLLVPQNCEFIVDDFEQEWADSPDSYDLVHARLLMASVNDYPKLLSQVFRAVKPGGYFEMHDIDCGYYCDDGTLPSDSAAVVWAETFREVCAKIGRPVLLTENYKRLMEEAGFVNIQERHIKRPINSWPKDPRMKKLGAVSYSWIHLQG